MKPTTHSSIGDTAAAWLARHDRGLTAAEREAFARWRDADWRHAEEFVRLQEDWQTLELARGHEELAAEARLLARATALEPRPATRPVSSSRTFWLRGLAAAAAIALIAVVGFNLREDTTRRPMAYEVIPSTARALKLPDGSVVELRGDSEVAVAFTAAERTLELVKGEAHFSVVKDPARPFVVKIGNVAVRAVGTAFNVRRDAAAIEVLVTEGRVRVDHTLSGNPLIAAIASEPEPLLQAGQRLTVSLDAAAPAPAAAAAPVSVRPAEIEQILSWQKTRLVFNRTSLEEAVKAFNEHGAQKLVIGDDELRSQLLGGTFRSDNVEAFVRLLEQGDEVRAEARADGTTVLRKL